MRDTTTSKTSATETQKATAKADPVPKAPPKRGSKKEPAVIAAGDPLIRVRRIHRRDLNSTWEFLKLVFRDVNRETVEYQRPRSKKRFVEVYEEEGVEQLLFEVVTGKKGEIVGYAECALEVTGSDNWMNERYFSNRSMRPLFVEELAVHPGYQRQGIGGFILSQLEHLARVRGCTHLVLEVAENNKRALNFYRARTFYKMDAAIFLAKKVAVESELLPPRRLKSRKGRASDESATFASSLLPQVTRGGAKAGDATASTRMAKALETAPTPSSGRKHSLVTKMNGKPSRTPPSSSD